MSVTTHERPGVYSEYDASSVVQGRQGRKMVGMAAIHATAPAGVPQTVTSYEGALIAFGSTGGQDMTELIRLALKNGAAGVVAGAQAPVILASRADSRETLMPSIALALVSMEANTTGGV